MYLFFDTETTGLPKNWKAPITDLENWPRLVQLAWLVYDNIGNKISTKNFIVKPSGFIISEESTKIHGCLLYTSPSPRDRTRSRMPSSA